MNDTTYPETTKTETTKAYPNGYAIYKPNQRGTGGVVRFNLNAEKGAVFVEAAAQSGEKQFDWDSKIIMKWGSQISEPLLPRCKAAPRRQSCSTKPTRPAAPSNLPSVRIPNAHPTRS